MEFSSLVGGRAAGGKPGCGMNRSTKPRCGSASGAEAACSSEADPSVIRLETYRGGKKIIRGATARYRCFRPWRRGSRGKFSRFSSARIANARITRHFLAEPRPPTTGTTGSRKSIPRNVVDQGQERPNRTTRPFGKKSTRRQLGAWLISVSEKAGWSAEAEAAQPAQRDPFATASESKRRIGSARSSAILENRDRRRSTVREGSEGPHRRRSRMQQEPAGGRRSFEWRGVRRQFLRTRRRAPIRGTIGGVFSARPAGVG